jgi:photosystem II stability/assembly factor-like uncharacterized protein
MRFFLLAAFLATAAAPNAVAQWQKQSIATDADFRGLCAVSGKVAWVSGTKGSFGRTIDGGATWSAGIVAGAEKLDFRDVEAFGESTAYLLSIGPGEDSRIYKTTDAGKTWALQFKNADRDAFFDALAFWDDKAGIALSDPMKGRFVFVTTTDGGASWKPLTPKTLSAALPEEGAFAASGTCLVTRGDQDVWFVTGGAKVARVFHSVDRGQNWTAVEVPIPAGVASAGVFSIAFRDKDHGMLVGGDYKKPTGDGPHAAVTADGGKTWTLAAKPTPFRSGVTWAKDRWIAVGTSGSHVSPDDGKTREWLDRENYNAVHAAATGECWAAGPKGRIAKLTK